MVRTRLFRVVGLAFAFPLWGATPVFNEVTVRPRGPEGEWVEILNPGPDTWTVDGWTLADGTGTRRTIPGRLDLPPGGFLVLAARPESLRAAYAIPDSVPVAKPSSWPILNDHDAGSGEPADRLVLGDREGNVIDSLAYFESWLPPQAGRSLERVDPAGETTAAGAWGWCQDPAGGTPGRVNSLAEATPAASGIWVGPDRVSPRTAPAVFHYRLPGPGTLAISLLDREGREVASLEPPRPAAARGSWVWGRGAPVTPRTGLYFLCLRWQAEGLSPVRRCLRVWVTP